MTSDSISHSGKIVPETRQTFYLLLGNFFPIYFISFHSSKEKPTAWKTGETEDYSQDTSYLEELEKHKFSVWWVTLSCLSI